MGGPCEVNIECLTVVRVEARDASAACQFWVDALPRWGATITYVLASRLPTTAILRFNRRGPPRMVGEVGCIFLQPDQPAQVLVKLCVLPPPGETDRCAIFGERPN